MSDDALLPPLWQLAASYLDCAELWFYADVFPRLPPRPDLVKSMCSRGPVIRDIVVGDHTHMLGELGALGVRFASWEIHAAVQVNRVEIMKWLQETDPELVRVHYASRPSAAAEAGAFDVLVWENETKINPWTAMTCITVAMWNHFDVLRRLRERSVPWTSNTYLAAVRSGNVEMVKWIEKEDFSITDFAPESAIKTVPMLQHFINRGLMNNTQLSYFVSKPNVECSIDLTLYVMETAMNIKHDEIVYWLAVLSANREKVRLAVDLGYPLPSPHAVAQYAAREVLESVGWRPGF